MKPKPRERWNVSELIALRDTLYPLLGWKGSWDLDLATDNVNIGDLVMFMNLQKDVKPKNLRRRLKRKLPAFHFNILENDSHKPTPYFLAITLSEGKKEAET